MISIGNVALSLSASDLKIAYLSSVLDNFFVFMAMNTLVIWMEY